MTKHTILIIDDEKSVHTVLKAALNKTYDVLTTSKAQEGIEMVKERHIDMVITDLKMKPVDGLTVLREVKKIKPSVVVLMMTAFASVETAVGAMKEGAYEYVIKPFKIDQMRLLVERALEHKTALAENKSLKEQLHDKYAFDNIVGNSESITKVFKLVKKVAATDSTVLIIGESGTGKELIAKALHHSSTRKDKTFVAVDCGALAENILESELFGHAKGAFTGAVSSKRGLFEEADGGTLFLDEISSVTPMMQSKLLRVLQEREVKPVGENTPRKVDVRILAAANVSLEKLVEEGKFREDLFYRLNVIQIDIPPLRKRKDDVLLLINHFIKNFRGNSVTLSEEAKTILTSYSWPGNVRELENVIERGCALSGDTILSEDLPQRIIDKAEKDISKLALKDVVDNAERNHIVSVLESLGGDKKLAAKKLGLDTATLYRKIKKLGIEK